MTSHEQIPSPAASTNAAKQKFAKELQEVLAVRTPQKKLDPRIWKSVMKYEGELVPPYLHYGFLLPPDTLKPYIIRNNIEFTRNKSGMYREEYHQASATLAVEKFLREKCGGFRIKLGFALGEGSDRLLVSVDNTIKMSHTFDDRWDENVTPVLNTLREEFGLGDQEPMWRWDSVCDTGYVCPIRDFNPPRMNEEYIRKMPRFYDEADFSERGSNSDSDSDCDYDYNYDSGSATETEC